MNGRIPSVFHLKVVTPKRLLVEADVESASLPTLEGEIGILPGHRPLVVGIGKGRLGVRAGGNEESFFVQGGYAQVEPERVLVMTEIAEDDKADGSTS